MPSFICT
jgi:hypothetical protein